MTPVACAGCFVPSDSLTALLERSSSHLEPGFCSQPLSVRRTGGTSISRFTPLTSTLSAVTRLNRLEPGRALWESIEASDTFVVTATADGSELSRWPAPRSLTGRLQRLRDRSRAVSRKQRGSANRARAVRQLSREYAHIANLRRSFLHEVSGQLAKTHSRLVIEDLQVANLMANPRLARAITDAGWTVFARQLTYKAQWFGGELVVCDRWFPSTKTCHACGVVKQEVRLRQRVFFCDACGHACDRDRNAAANLAAWADRNHVPRTVKQAAGLPMSLEELAPPVGSPTACPSPTKGEPTLGLRPESRTSEKDGVGAPRKVLGAL